MGKIFANLSDKELLSKMCKEPIATQQKKKKYCGLKMHKGSEFTFFSKKIYKWPTST